MEEIDVSKCEFYKDGRCHQINSLFMNEDDEPIEPFEEFGRCDAWGYGNAICEFEKLFYKEKELELISNSNKMLIQDNTNIANENTKLKQALQEIKEICTDCKNNDDNEAICCLCKNADRCRNEDEYYSDYDIVNPILKIISEVEE